MRCSNANLIKLSQFRVSYHDLKHTLQLLPNEGDYEIVMSVRKGLGGWDLSNRPGIFQSD